MPIKNQGYRQDLNLSEHTDDTAVWSNLYKAGISNDLSVMRNNLRNTSTVGFSSLTGNGASGIASFFTTLKSNGEPTDFIFTNDDVVGVGASIETDRNDWRIFKGYQNGGFSKGIVGGVQSKSTHDNDSKNIVGKAKVHKVTLQSVYIINDCFFLV